LLSKKLLGKEKTFEELSENAKARKVPYSRLGRMMTFGGLAAGLGAGTIAELTRRTLGMKGTDVTGSLLGDSAVLSEANAKRIVDTLCKVRGAALKLGQMMSIQDNALINPQLQRIFDRVRQSADFMPIYQLEVVLIDEFGSDWRSRVSTFDERPFAAASIGQVHLATLLDDGRSVAMKIQYPGVADGIESDINNLIATLKVANVLPEGLYLDQLKDLSQSEAANDSKKLRELAVPNGFSLPSDHAPLYFSLQLGLCLDMLLEQIIVSKELDVYQDVVSYFRQLVLIIKCLQFSYQAITPCIWSFMSSSVQSIAFDIPLCAGQPKIVGLMVHPQLTGQPKIVGLMVQPQLMTSCSPRLQMIRYDHSDILLSKWNGKLLSFVHSTQHILKWPKGSAIYMLLANK
ncbi:unnamed protein product, partial [Meganyctiphanes norvegica]